MRYKAGDEVYCTCYIVGVGEGRRGIVTEATSYIAGCVVVKFENGETNVVNESHLLTKAEYFKLELDKSLR